MRTGVKQDRARRLTIGIGVVIVGLSVVVAVIVAGNRRDLGPDDDVPRALAIPALFATVGITAIVGGLQERRPIVLACGLLCLLGTVLSAATLAFVVPGLALIYLWPRLAITHGRDSAETVVVLVVGMLVAGAAVALLALTDTRCWQASGSATAPTYTVSPCGPGTGPSPVALPGAWASGYDSGVLTLGGALAEGILLVTALGLTVSSGHRDSESA